MPLPAKDITGLAGLFAVSGSIHLVRPSVFEPIVPEVLPATREIVLASGVAELLCAAGLLHPRTRRAAGWASAALLVGVFPANVKMARDLSGSRKTGLKVGAWARLPLQLPMIRTALRAARGVTLR